MPHRITDQALTKFYKTYSPVLIANNLAGIPSEKELQDIFIPREFDARIESLIASLNDRSNNIPGKKSGKRTMIILVAALIAAATAVMTVSAAREWVIQVVTKALNTHTSISVYDAYTEELTPSEPAILPEGYQVFTKRTSGQTAYTVFAKPYGNIQLTESLLATELETLPNLKHTDINGISVQYREVPEDNLKQFFWTYNGLYYTLNIIDQTLSTNDVLTIIESIEYNNSYTPRVVTEVPVAGQFEPYTLTYLPDDYICTGQDINRQHRYAKISYQLSENTGAKIQLSQIGKGHFKIDSEHLDEYDDSITINGESATYMRKKDCQRILFDNGSYFFSVFIQDGSVDKKTAIRIAEGVVPTNAS
ncbi:DUF4367 domain-containing protein [Clostridium sp. D33t1_170424_F3]|uniref:DUF4367 domain-containing protein n=1 Tax=Clostridium sp. D33t1_170424_F3 TaxID=2787099 RepID=UPI0018AAAD69|nr:DUF4367 domain-containing protein [Clostridium sp. D33t1_170424_F3]